MMASGYAAMAETYVEGIGSINSLGKAGFNEDGSRKPYGCTSMANARRNAVRRLVNRARGLMMSRGLLPRTSVWVNRPELEKHQNELYQMLLEKVMNNAVWVESAPSAYASRIDGSGLRTMLAEVYA